MTKENKIYLGIGIGVFILIVITAIYFYLMGKKKNSTTVQQFDPNDLPYNDPSNSTNTGGVSNNEIKTIAVGLHDEMDGFNLLGHDMEYYDRALLLGNNDLIKLYNTFNALYQSDSGQTLTQWLDGEMFSSNFENSALVLKQRLKTLNML